MKFQIENGLDIISIRLSEIGSYFRCRKPLATVWHDYGGTDGGTGGKYLSLLPYDQHYRDEVRNRLIEHLNEDYTGRIAELKELINPLLMLFPSGKYSLNYHSAYRDNIEEIRYSGWDMGFAPPVNIRDKELRIEEYRQYVAENEKKKGRSIALMEYTTGGFYDEFTKVFVATQPKAEIDLERVKYFENEISNGARPFAIIFNCYLHQIEDGLDDSLDSAAYIIDGHHKLLAYHNLNIRPAIVEITYNPARREDVEFNVEELIDVLFPWQVEHILENWSEKEQYILKYLRNPGSKIHQFIKNEHIKTYHENGQLAHEAFYINDRIEGEGKWWYDNGQLKRVEYFKQRLRHGEWKKWYESGSIELINSFDEKGRNDGHAISYYESGKVRWEKFMKEGAPLDGNSELSWFENGAKETELEYLNGELIKRKNYNEAGILVSFYEYDPETNRSVKRI